MQLDTWSIEGQGFHFGRHGMGQEESAVIFTSDSFFSALVATLANSQGAVLVQEFIETVLSSPPAFVLSSLFPRAGNIRFFPIPRWASTKEEKNLNGTSLSFKSIKKVHYVSEKIFLELISGVPLLLLLQKSVFLQNGTIICSQEETRLLPAFDKKSKYEIWKTEQRPRVTIGRDSLKTNLFHTGRTWFAPGCGLWFAVKWNKKDPDLEKIFINLLEMLGDAGLGGERSSGFGKFEPKETGILELPEADGTSPWVTLSRYLPAMDEISALQDSLSVYQLERVGGWTDSPGTMSQRRKVIQMLSEGSVFGPIKKSDPGQIVDVQPEYDGLQPIGHPVWRSGIALAVGLKKPGGLS